MAEEDGLAVDVAGYGDAMEAAREKSRAGALELGKTADVMSWVLVNQKKASKTACLVCGVCARLANQHICTEGVYEPASGLGWSASCT